MRITWCRAVSNYAREGHEREVTIRRVKSRQNNSVQRVVRSLTRPAMLLTALEGVEVAGLLKAQTHFKPDFQLNIYFTAARRCRRRLFFFRTVFLHLLVFKYIDIKTNN